MLGNLSNLVLEWRFEPNPEFFLSSGGLLLGTLGSVYFLMEYLRHRRESKFLLYWAIGLLLLFWFRIPIILLNAGVRFYFSGFHAFLAAAFPLALVGLIFLLAGVNSVHPFINKRKVSIFLILWLILALAFFAALFLGPFPLVKSNFSVLVVNLLLFAPVRLFLLYAIVRWLINWWRSIDAFGRIGIVMLVFGTSLGALQHFIVLPRLLVIPTEFWFIAIGSFDVNFIVEIFSMMFLLLGAFLAHRDILDRLKTGTRGVI